MIGTTIRHHRLTRTISVSELAQRAGVSKSYISNLERDVQKNPSLKVIKSIANGLNVHYTELLEEE